MESIDWEVIGVMVIQVLAAVGVWAHVNPWIKNASNNKWVNMLLAFAKGVAGEYKHNRSID